ncbi:MAG TPA: hypothetical protein VGR26_07840 [Acidimicrobiales bacterium]|nr:hypothetical protein [Acidimicrobiales bacterium]
MVTYDVPTFRLPWTGGFGGWVITATGRRSEVVDPYREGLAVAPTSCAGLADRPSGGEGSRSR